MQKNVSKILVIRNDKLGDFMLAWPSFQALRQLFPDARIYALVPAYTSPMAEICPWVDEIVLDEDQHGLSGLLKTTAKIKKLNFDAALCLHSTPRIALALFLAGIRDRFAPASRIDQIMYNHTLTQRRSRSEKPEYEYNTDLALYMGQHYGKNITYTLVPPLLSFPEDELRNTKNQFYSEHNINQASKLIVLHAGSGGSATNLSINQYAQLIIRLSSNNSLFFVITAGPGEEKIVKRLSDKINGCNHVIYYSIDGLVKFSKLVSVASLFISGSTGTLHIAGALNVPVAAFYPQRRSATSLRWQTLNSPSERLYFTGRKSVEGDQLIVDIKTTARSISQKLR